MHDWQKNRHDTDFTDNGELIPVTVIQAGPVSVIQENGRNRRILRFKGWI